MPANAVCFEKKRSRLLRERLDSDTAGGKSSHPGITKGHSSWVTVVKLPQEWSSFEIIEPDELLFLRVV
jgi:hypothetical protein